MNERFRQWRTLTLLASCAAIALPLVWSGLSSQNENNPDQDAVADFDLGRKHHKEGRYAEAYCNMGSTYAYIKKPVLAKAAYQKALDLNPDEDTAYDAREGLKRLRGQ